MTDRLRRLAVTAVALACLAGCSGKAYVREGFLDHPPARVAVLPFAITYAYDLTEGQGIPPSHAIGRDVFRKTFYYALTPLGYQDVKLADVDARLTTAFGPIDAGAWRQADPQALGKALGVDAVIYGEIARLMHFSTPLYTETSLQASLRMVDTASGQELWRKQVKAAERGGALMKKGQVVDLIKDQARSFHPEVKFLRISDAAVRQLLKDFPNPPMVVAEEPAVAAGSIRLALLPLDAKKPGWDKQAATLRAQLAASLQETPFAVIELQQVDAALKALGWTEGGPLPETPLPELAQALGADALLRGTVTKWGRTYLIVQSWVTAGMALELVDGRTGDVLWSGERSNRRQAGILKGPTGYKSVVTAPLKGLSTGNLERVATHLAREITQDLNTAPAVLAYVSEKP